jgi:hypothetical protein
MFCAAVGLVRIATYFTVAFMRIGFSQHQAMAFLGSKWWFLRRLCACWRGLGIAYWLWLMLGVARLSTAPSQPSIESAEDSGNIGSPKGTRSCIPSSQSARCFL